MSQFSALVRKSGYHAANSWRIIKEQHPFKRVFIVLFALGLESGLFSLFKNGFEFLDSFQGIGSIIIARLFSVFFMGMSGMLVVSSIVTGYVTMFRSDEIPFLVVRPFPMSAIAVYKFIQSLGLSSWAFFFVIIPFVAAFAWHQSLSPLFALWTLLFSIPFLVVCGGVGVVVMMLVVRFFPRVRITWIAVALFLVCILFPTVWIFREAYPSSQGSSFDIGSLVPGFRLASNAWLPNWWFAEGILALSRQQWVRGSMLWLVLSANAMLIMVAVEWLGECCFYETWQHVCGSRSTGVRNPVLLPRLDRWLGIIPGDIRAMVMKDIRFFLRDPMQWSQVLIFFGLLAIYFANLRAFRYDALPSQWRNIIAFLNVFSVSAVISSLGSRFVYPQLSLEGQGFWILGLSPTTMTRILLTKFLMACTGMVLVSIMLMGLSTGMLRIASAARFASIGLVSCIACAVCGMSCGLGAVFLDLKQRNPSAIVSGFGGTLNLVLSLGFLIATILPFGLIFHLDTTLGLSVQTRRIALAVATGWLGIITLLATGVPLWLGVRSLNNRDY